VPTTTTVSPAFTSSNEPASVVVTFVFEVVSTFVVVFRCSSETVRVEPSIAVMVPTAPGPAKRICGPPGRSAPSSRPRATATPRPRCSSRTTSPR
jgi:hypothetical protein